MNWFDGLIAFEKVAEAKNFAVAAKQLKMTSSAITKRIQWLEENLGADLFIRTTRRVDLTESGKQLLSRVKSLLAEWNDIRGELQDFYHQPHGSFSICFPPNVAGLELVQSLLQKFLSKYPKLSLRLTHFSEAISLAEKKIDVLIATERYVLQPDITIGKKLFDFKFQCVCSPTYLKTRGLPKNPADLINHNCITYQEDNQWLFGGKAYTVRGNLIADSGDSIIAACKDGVGIAYAPDFIVEHLVAKKKLVHILTEYKANQATMYAFYSKMQYQPRKIAVFVDFIKKHLKQD